MWLIKIVSILAAYGDELFFVYKWYEEVFDMKKSRFASLLIVLALIGMTTFTSQAFGSRGIRQTGSSPDSESAGDFLRSNPNLGNCFTANFPAASDCDRLASQQVSQRPAVVILHGLTLQNCFSGEYHAGSDCDRLASLQGSPLFVISGPTLLNCYSAVYHAGSDCDRLASGNR